MFEASVREQKQVVQVYLYVLCGPTLSSSDVSTKTAWVFKQIENKAHSCRTWCMCGAFAYSAAPVVRASRFASSLWLGDRTRCDF